MGVFVEEELGFSKNEWRRSKLWILKPCLCVKNLGPLEYRLRDGICLDMYPDFPIWFRILFFRYWKSMFLTSFKIDVALEMQASSVTLNTLSFYGVFMLYKCWIFTGGVEPLVVNFNFLGFGFCFLILCKFAVG